MKPSPIPHAPLLRALEGHEAHTGEVRQCRPFTMYVVVGSIQYLTG